LSKNLTIVLEDKEVMHHLCGVNDANLKIIENILDEQVFTRGNEVFITSENQDKRNLFKILVTRLKNHTSLGHIPGPDLIQAINESIQKGSNEKEELLQEFHIFLPGSNTKVYPRSYNQATYIQGMNTKDIVFGIGPAGTGKTFLAVAYALNQILTREKKKLILTRPVVEAGESLGFLPGDLAQKISPYLRPLYDAMDALISPEVIRRLEESRIIEIAPLAYMRGRSLKECCIILDEAQNSTREQMKMFLTRMGEDSQIIVTGDATQIDLPRKDHSGLLHAMHILHSINDIHFTYLEGTDVVRNPLIKKIIHAYEKEEQ
jgi:phosphate starvation-inducible protein PhoH and related proteins